MAPPAASSSPERGPARRGLGLRPFWVACLVALALVALPSVASAYPWMIRHDYAVCGTCHVDPSGAGVMTLYGRAQSEVLLRSRYGSEAGDDAIEIGGFPLASWFPEALLLQGDARAAALHVAPPSPAPTVDRYLLMQADLAAGLMLDRVRASGSLGFVHAGGLAASVTHGEADRLVSRQHWLGFVLGEEEQFTVRAGRMNLPYGLRVIEHPLWIKAATHTDIDDDQQHGLALTYTKEAWRGEVMGILGNLQISPADLREHGYSAYLERAFGERAAVGLSSLVTHADIELASGRPAFRQAHGVFGRYAPTEALVVMAEGDALVHSPKGVPIEIGATGMLQLDFEPTQGLHLIGTGEVLNTSFSAGPASLGVWGSAAWFFAPHADLRVDVIHQSIPVLDSRASVTSILGQLHVFL